MFFEYFWFITKLTAGISVLLLTIGVILYSKRRKKTIRRAKWSGTIIENDMTIGLWIILYIACLLAGINMFISISVLWHELEEL